MKTIDFNILPNFDSENTIVYDYSKPWTEEDSKCFASKINKCLRLIIDNKTVVECNYYRVDLGYIRLVYSTDYNVNCLAIKNRSFEKFFKDKNLSLINHSTLVAIITLIKEYVQKMHNISDEFTKFHINAHSDFQRVEMMSYIVDKCIHELDRTESETAWLTLANLLSIGADLTYRDYTRFVSYFGMHKNVNEFFFNYDERIEIYSDYKNYRILSFIKNNHEDITIDEYVERYDILKHYTPETIINENYTRFWNIVSKRS